MTEFFPDEDNAGNIKLQAEERLRAAKELLKLGFFNDAISRAYYAMFSAVTLLFYTQGKSFSKHKGLITNFHKDFIRTGIFPEYFGTAFSDLFRKRQESDYKASIHFDKKEAETSINVSEELIGSVLRYVRKNYPDLLE